MEHNANKRKSFRQTALMIACKIGDIVAVREILEWRDDDGKRPDISAKDKNGQTALSFAEHSNNAEIVALIKQNLFLTAVENGDIETIKSYLTVKESNVEVADTNILTDRHEHSLEQMEKQSPEDNPIKEPPTKILKGGPEEQFTSKDLITHSVWLEAVAIAQHKCHDEMLNLLFNDDRFIHGFNEDGQTALHQAVAEYLKSEDDDRKLKTIEILLKSGKFSINILNLKNETILEIICKIEPNDSIGNDYIMRKFVYRIPPEKPDYDSQTDKLLRILHKNGFDLNDRNKKDGETFLMLACTNKCIEVVRGLIKMVSHGFVLDIDAVDNSGETALMKAKERDFYIITEALLKFKLISAVKQENADIVKSMLSEFHKAPDIFVKSWSSKKDLKDMVLIEGEKPDIWLEAVDIAMENDAKYSEEILKLLFDSDFLLSRGIEIGHFSFYQLMRGWQDAADKRLRLFEMLLKSGKINVNTRDKKGRTALHWAEEEKLISLLIRYGADVNRKDNDGTTPLMPIPYNMGEGTFPVMRTLLEEAETLVNLDAIDCDGRTALIHAVRSKCSHDVRLLLKKGASVNLSDHLGLTALHHALHRNIRKYFEFPRNSEELKKIKEIAISFDDDDDDDDDGDHVNEYEAYYPDDADADDYDDDYDEDYNDDDAGKPHEGNKKWHERSKKIVEVLLRRPDIAFSNYELSPLDIAEGCIPQIPSSIRKALKESGAVLNVFRETETQSTTDFYLDFTCKFTLKQLAKTVNKLNERNLDFLKKRWLDLIKTSETQIASSKDQQGRKALHLVAIACYRLVDGNEYISDFADAIVDELISLGCSVNETDNFGRTPLHYANEMLSELLIFKGADTSIKDNDGNFASDETSRESSDEAFDIHKLIDRNDETFSLRLMNNKQMEINVQCVDDSNGDSVPGLIWEKGEYAFCHPLFEKITNEVTALMDSIAKEIGKLDPRFEVGPQFVGSSNEGAKTDKPDEFDFCFVLTKISELCQVCQSPELPPGFVHLKRRPKIGDDSSNFDSFFEKEGILNTEKLKWQFTNILSKALGNIERQLNFEWILELKFGHTRFSDNICKVLNIKMIKPLNFFTVDEISIDIVPCIHVDGWWPDDAISNVSDEIKKFGCNFVFDRPQELYPWVPYSESCARISFSNAETVAVKQSCANAKEAFMIGKMMIENSHKRVVEDRKSLSDESYKLSNYNLKNCLLYCIEALTPTSETASQLGLSHEELESQFHQMDRYLWLKCLMKCHLEFVAQDFCPSYFLPKYSSKVGANYLKSVSFDWIGDYSSTFPRLCKFACVRYRCASNDISEGPYQLPAPDPLWERFDRKQLIASLCEIAYK